MPELPEVQTVINTLKDSGLLHKTIKDVLVYKVKLLKNSSPKQFQKFLIGEQVVNIERKGKFLIFHLSHRKTLVIHLRMEGKLFYEPNESNVPKAHLRIEFVLNNKHTLRYYDSRIFGTFHIYQGDAHLKAPQLTKLALDPLDSKFDWKYLKNHLSGSHRAIKTTLLDQTLVAGIGNIYADEILFLSHIHPLRKPSTLSDNDFKQLTKNSKLILNKAIKHGGTTVSSYK
jgi:formamidopyrimidine-DNA glycosylase